MGVVQCRSGLDLLLRAEFEVHRGKVREFRIVLLRIRDSGQEEWIVRYETHGGRAHKHERWEDDGEDRHKHPQEWRGPNSQLVTQAIKDIYNRFEEYERRYEAWQSETN